MDLNKEQKRSLLDLKTIPDADDIRYKEKIKQTIIRDDLLIYLLNNKGLEESGAEPSDYLGVNILPYYMIRPTQSDVQNYVCYETQMTEQARYNKIIKYQQVIFYIVCHQKTIIESATGLARHDLISARIINDFNWSNIFGFQIHLVSNKPGTVDTDYALRTLIFEGSAPNSIVKTVNGVPYASNFTG